MGDDGQPLVLVAEEHPATSLVSVLALEGAGCRAVTTADGASALTFAAKLRPTLLLADVRMSLVDGVELAAHPRPGRRAPASDPDERQPPAPPDDIPFLARPFDLDELFALVAIALQLPT